MIAPFLFGEVHCVIADIYNRCADIDNKCDDSPSRREGGALSGSYAAPLTVSISWRILKIGVPLNSPCRELKRVPAMEDPILLFSMVISPSSRVCL